MFHTFPRHFDDFEEGPALIGVEDIFLPSQPVPERNRPPLLMRYSIGFRTTTGMLVRTTVRAGSVWDAEVAALAELRAQHWPISNLRPVWAQCLDFPPAHNF